MPPGLKPRAIWSSQARATANAAAGHLPPAMWLGLTLVASHLGLFLLVALARRLAEEAPPLARPRAGDRSQSGWVVRAGLRVFFRAGARNLRGCFLYISATGSTARPRGAAGSAIGLGRRGRRRRSGVSLSRANGVVGLAWTSGRAASAGCARPLRDAVDAGRRSADRAAGARRGPFFGENFQRRTARSLNSSPAMPASPRWSRSQPQPGRVFILPGRRSAAPGPRPSISSPRGSVLVWPASDNSGTPPTSLRAQFPTMVPEVPRSFARSIQGRLPLIRIGWAAMRPINP